MARIAVLMSVYNPGHSLLRTLDSLAGQSLSFKLFFVDDGSSDAMDFPGLLKTFDHCFIQLADNTRLVGALNAGLEAITNEGFDYIARIDAGDAMMPERLEFQAGFLDDYPKIGVVGSASQIVDLDGMPVDQWTTPEHDASIRRVMPHRIGIVETTAMFRAGLFERLGFYDPDYTYASDYEMLNRILLHSGGHNLPLCLTSIMNDPESFRHKYCAACAYDKLQVQIRYADPRNVNKNLGILRSAFRYLTTPRHRVISDKLTARR